MGCVSSTPAEPPAPAAQPSPKPRNHPVAAAAAATPAPAPAAYETELSASLAEGGAQSVAYHGLLNDKNAISLTRAQHSPLHKLVHRSVAPSDAHASVPHLTVVRGVAMTMPYTVIVSKRAVESQLSQLVTAVFDQYNAILNAWNAHSEISAINALPPAKKMPLSAQLQQLFSVVDHVFDITDARFDPTTAVLNICFENCIRDKGRPPLPTELQHFKHAVGWKRRVTRHQNTVSRTNANTIIDLDGIAKGFVIDCIVQALLQHGYTDVYVDWAADVRAVGNHPSGRPWRAALMQPPQLKRVFQHWREQTLPDMLSTDDVSLLASLQLEAVQDVAIATSGDYFCVQKYGYHHIARASDLSVMKASANSVASVCIAASTCAVADAVATAAMTFDAISDAVQFCARLCERFPRIMYAYCVMGRDRDANHYSSAIFEPFAVESAQPSEARLRGAANDVAPVAAQLASELRSKIFGARAVVKCAGRSQQVHSLVSVSMWPQQLVSFEATNALFSGGETACECVLLHNDSSPVGASSEAVLLHLVVWQVYSVSDHAAVVVASVEKVHLGDVDRLQLVHGDAVLARRNIALSCVRSKFELAPLVDQCRDVFRNFASMIWIISSMSVEQQLFALTATSVGVSELMGEFVSFNILHTSTFYAAFGGVGSQVCLYALSGELGDVATKYTAKSDVDKADVSRLESKSLAAVEGSVVMVNDVQDHHVVVVRMRHIRLNDGVSRPLIWLQGDFV